jgi:hypothetical protein
MTKRLLVLAFVAASSTVSVAHAQSSATSAQTATSASNNQNSQSNGLNATINPSTTIQFNSPPMQRSESAMTQDSTARINQSVTGTTEQVLSGTRTDRIEYSGTTTVKNVPAMNAPPLVSSNDTCMGSWSAGVAVAGFGASGGNTYTDEHCKRIKMSRELWNKGMKAASLALDCMDKEAREALEITGFVCPQTARAQHAAALAAAAVRVANTPARVAAAQMGFAVNPTAEASDSETVRVLSSPYRPGYEYVNHDDPYINR